MKKFIRIKHIPGAHSFWYEVATGDLLCADQSMRVSGDPTTGDDGRIAVDIVKILQRGFVAEKDPRGRYGPTVPVICHGEASYTLCSPAEVGWLWAHLTTRTGARHLCEYEPSEDSVDRAERYYNVQ